VRTVVIQPSFDSWRVAARDLLARRVPPGDVLWSDVEGEVPLFARDEGAPCAAASPVPTPPVPAVFLDMARSAAAHRDPRHLALLYQILWRITHGGERHLPQLPTDPDMRLLCQWCKAVGRDIHKMHAFVRFRLIGTDEESGRERFVAWFEPEHRILRLAVPFFRKRFPNMEWSILTPDECAHWDGSALAFTPGVARGEAPDEDAHDDLWRTYYRSIFNPARLKVNAMQSEMPKKYWKNLPEARLIAGLIAESRERVQTMLETQERPVKPAPKNAYLDSLRQRNASTAGEASPPP
jgi:uracil-DNA glycosylase